MGPRQRSLEAACLAIVTSLASSVGQAAEGWPQVSPPLPPDWRGDGGGLASADEKSVVRRGTESLVRSMIDVDGEGPKGMIDVGGEGPMSRA
jgi:hypothetical protein